MMPGPAFQGEYAIGSACEQPVLLGPVERQIEFGPTRRGELDGLPTLQDCVNELWVKKGEVDKATDIAPVIPSRSAH